MGGNYSLFIISLFIIICSSLFVHYFTLDAIARSFSKDVHVQIRLQKDSTHKTFMASHRTVDF